MLLDPKLALRVVTAVPGIPRDTDGRVCRDVGDQRQISFGKLSWGNLSVDRFGARCF